MSQRVCRSCGQKFEHPAPASLSTKRNCHDCMQLSDGIRRALERHLTEINRLRKQLEKLRGETPAEPSPTDG